MPDPILVADIGGTHARFAIARRGDDGPTIHEMKNFRVKDFTTFHDAVDAYLATISAKPLSACIAAAGPVDGDHIAVTNSSWVLRAADIASALGLASVRLVNDFYALSVGVIHLGDDAFISIKDGARVGGAPQLVLGPGTGFGQSLIAPVGASHKVFATEGGHASFAALTDEEAQVRAIIARDCPHVSIERVLSGPGLLAIYRALCAVMGKPCILDRPEDITGASSSGGDPVADRTVTMFCEILGSHVGDAALSAGARGGVVLGGGVLAGMRESLLNGAFTRRFVDKGPMTDYVGAIPVRLLVGDGAALIGAAALFDDRCSERNSSLRAPA